MPQTPEELEALRVAVTKELEKLTQEDRSEVWRTVWSSLNLPQEQRKTLLGMEDDRRKKARAEAEEFFKANGIQFGNDQAWGDWAVAGGVAVAPMMPVPPPNSTGRMRGGRRHAYHRFFSERRTIEETLKKEGETRRATLIQEFNAKLKVEFATAAAGTPGSPPVSPDALKPEGPKREPGARPDFFRPPPRGDRPEGDGKGPGDAKNGAEGTGPEGKPRGEFPGRGGPGRGGPGGPGGPGAGPGGPGSFGPPGPKTPQELEAMRKRAMTDIEKLTQEQRTEIWRTVAAVLKLTPEQRKTILTMETERRQKAREDLRKEMDETIANNGIQLTTNELRGKFFYRYVSGRRKVDETLKKEDEARRTALMQELGTKLKIELATTTGTPVAPVPVPGQK